MNRPRRIRETWQPIALVVVLLLVASIAGSRRTVQIRQQLIEESLNGTYLSAAAYAQAAERWLMDEDTETLLRVSRLMISGGTRLIEIKDTHRTVLELIASELPSEIVAQTARAPVDTLTRTLLRTHSGWIIEIVIPLKQAVADTWEVRVWMDAEPLHMRATVASLEIYAVAFSCWLALSGGIVLRSRSKKNLSNAETSVSEFARSAWRVDPERKRISLREHPISLTPKQYAFLALLVSGGRRVFSEEEILKSIWPQSPYADSNDIRQCVYKIRKRIAMVAPGAEACIVNEKGFGYRFEPSQVPDDEFVTSIETSGSAINKSTERRTQ